MSNSVPLLFVTGVLGLFLVGTLTGRYRLTPERIHVVCRCDDANVTVNFDRDMVDMEFKLAIAEDQYRP